MTGQGSRKKKAGRRRSPAVKRQNVFEDLGFSKSQSVALQRKADLHAQILGIYQDGGYTQAQFGELLGQQQPHISRLLTGRLEDISIEKMIGHLEKLGAELVTSRF